VGWFVYPVRMKGPLTIEAEFDGKVIVPSHALPLPAHSQLDITIRVKDVPAKKESAATKRQILERITAGAVKGADIPAEALRRRSLYEDR
jgi:hypothetical protein